MPTQCSEARGFRRGSNAVVQCDLEVLRKSGVRLFSGANGVLLAAVPADAIFRILAADNQRGDYTEVLAEIGSDRRLRLVRDLRAEAVEAAAAAMGESAAAAGSADAAASAAPAEGAEVEDADTDQERSAADVDMTEAAVANPSLTVGELVDVRQPTSSSSWLGTWRAPLEWFSSRERSPYERVRSTAGFWSTLKSSSTSRRSI